MTAFAASYLGRLRLVVGDRLILSPGARVVVEDDQGRILLQKRSDFGVWGVPGGGPDEGEDLISCVIRELEEETGLVADDPFPFGFASDPAYETITFPNGHRCQYFVLMFAVRAFSGTARVADDESRAIGWFRTDSLPEMLPNMRRTVEAYLAFKETSTFQMI